MVKRKTAYVAAAGIAVSAATVIILNSPVDAVYFGVPPAMLLSTSTGEFEAGVGSFCGQTGPFTYLCVDRTLEGSIPDETVVIPQGSSVTVRFVGYSHPELLQTMLRDADLEVSELELTKLSETEFVADVPKGGTC